MKLADEDGPRKRGFWFQERQKESLNAPVKIVQEKLNHGSIPLLKYKSKSSVTLYLKGYTTDMTLS